MIAFVYAHHPCRSPRRPPSHLCASSSSTSSHTARRETATSSRYSYALTSNAHIPWQKALLLYYLIVVLERNTLYFSTLNALYMNPKGSQAFCFDDWRASWAYLGHILDTSCSLGSRLIPPFHPPFRSLDHVHCKPSASIKSHLRTL